MCAVLRSLVFYVKNVQITEEHKLLHKHLPLLGNRLISCKLDLEATFSAFSRVSDEMSKCVSLTALLCDIVTMLGPTRGSINRVSEVTGKRCWLRVFWNGTGMDPQTFTCRRKKNVGMCTFVLPHEEYLRTFACNVRMFVVFKP